MQSINLNLVPGSFQQVFNCSQGDIGRQLTAKLFDGSTAYEIPAGSTVKIKATKPSGFGFDESATFSGSTVTITTAETMTNEWGRFPAELVITKDGNVIGTANFLFNIEKNPHPDSTVDGDAEEVIPELTLLVERVEAAASSVLDMEVVATTLPAGSQASYSYDEDLNKATFGIPQGEAGAGAAGVVASAYSSSKTYKVGDYVLHNSNLYRCITAITTAEAFTAAHWTQIVLADDVSDLKSDLNDACVTVTGQTYYTIGDAIRAQVSDLINKTNPLKLEFTFNGYLNPSNGKFSAYTNNPYPKTTDYIETKNYGKVFFRYYVAGSTVGMICYYDIDKNFISAYTTSTANQLVDGYDTIPSNAYFVRCCMWNTTNTYLSREWMALGGYGLREQIVESDPIAYQPYLLESLYKPFDFEGKSIAWFGDSIAYGICSPNIGTTDGFIRRFANSFNMTNQVNSAVSGTCIADPDSSTSILNKVLNNIAVRNYYFVEGGVNDFVTNKELGTFASTSTSTFYGALKAICEKFATDFSSGTVIFITPLPLTKAYYDAHPEFKRGNTLGYTLDDYRKAMYEVATYYGYNVVDGASLGFPIGKGGWANAMCDDTDGCHPTIDGHKMLARTLRGKLL